MEFIPSAFALAPRFFPPPSPVDFKAAARPVKSKKRRKTGAVLTVDFAVNARSMLGRSGKELVEGNCWRKTMLPVVRVNVCVWFESAASCQPLSSGHSRHFLARCFTSPPSCYGQDARVPMCGGSRGACVFCVGWAKMLRAGVRPQGQAENGPLSTQWRRVLGIGQPGEERTFRNGLVG